jgi:hypothetical protein
MRRAEKQAGRNEDRQSEFMVVDVFHAADDLGFISCYNNSEAGLHVCDESLGEVRLHKSRGANLYGNHGAVGRPP